MGGKRNSVQTNFLDPKAILRDDSRSPSLASRGSKVHTSAGSKKDAVRQSNLRASFSSVKEPKNPGVSKPPEKTKKIKSSERFFQLLGKSDCWNPKIKEMEEKMKKVSVMRGLTIDQIRNAKDIDSLLNKKHPGQAFQQGRRTAMRMSLNRGRMFTRDVIVSKNEQVNKSPKKAHFQETE